MKTCNNNFILDSLRKLKKNQDIQLWNYQVKYNNFIHLFDIIRLLELLISIKKKNDRKIINCLVSKPTKLENIISLMKRKLRSNSKIIRVKKNLPILRLYKKSESRRLKFNFLSSIKTISSFVRK